MVARTIRLSDGTTLRVAASMQDGVVRIALDEAAPHPLTTEPDAPAQPSPALPTPRRAPPMAPLFALLGQPRSPLPRIELHLVNDDIASSSSVDPYLAPFPLGPISAAD